MNRAEHLAWAKKRAYEELERNGCYNAWASFTSDMNKHDELRGHPALIMGLQLWMAGFLDEPAAMRQHIEGYN